MDWLPELGSARIDRLEPGRSAVVSIPWVPLTSGHTCFLARIDASTDKLTHDGWVPFDNNVCQRNLQVLDPASPHVSAGFGAGNRKLGSGYGTLTAKSDDFPTGGSGTVRFKDAALFARWRDAGGTVSGGQVVQGQNAIQLEVKAGAGGGLGRVDLAIERVPFEGEETTELVLEVTGPPGARPPTVHLGQTQDGEAVGGIVVRPPLRPAPAYLPAAYR
jgi:hypothetical protein